MISILGSAMLYLALLAAALQSVLPFIGYWRRNHLCLAFAIPCALAQCFFILLAYILLTVAFITHDFNIVYVAQNSHLKLPLLYRLTAVFGAHEGSFLLWITLLNLWSMAVIVSLRHSLMRQFNALTLAMLGAMNTCFLCFLILTSNPFLSALTPLSGQDLNPLLQDPGFVIHPPMLYIGYVGFSVAFAMVLAALIQGNLPSSLLSLIRRFTLAAWCFLTLGIALGSWWAYRVLGWGGFWFWDPVENASLLPWLSGTAFIHVLLLSERKGLVKGFAAILAIMTFALSLLGTFLVRSGVLVSVHTFANDPARGIFLLLLLAIMITAALWIYIKRLPLLNSSSYTFSPLSRETGLLVNSGLLLIAMTTLLLGTLYPLIIDALHLSSISVGAPYFNTVMLPLVLLTMACMGVGVLLPWQQAPNKTKVLTMAKKAAFSAVCAAVLLLGVAGQLTLTTWFSLSLSLWIIFSVSDSARFYPGMALAHTGFAVLVIGILLSSLLSQTSEVRMKPGNTTTLGPYQFHFQQINGIQGANYRGLQATFDISKNNKSITTLLPEKRIYVVRDMVMTKVAIHPSLFRDLYLALGEPLDENSWSVRLYYKPFIRWIWLGALLMILGGILAILQRRIS
jgi:cytochrome c-type biogenesis protein CcmF